MEKVLDTYPKYDTMNDYNFKEAHQNLVKVDCDISAMEWFEKYANDIDITKNPVLAALRIADRLQRGDVSDEMCIEGDKTLGFNNMPTLQVDIDGERKAFKAMAERLIKEVKET